MRITDAKESVRLALRIEVRNLVLALQRGHAVVAERYPLARVFERRPDDVPQGGSLRCLRHGFCFRHFLSGEKCAQKKVTQ